MRFRALPGFRDFYPREMALRRWIERAWHEASRCAGFEEIDGPVLESLDLLKAKTGEQVVSQLYAFGDKGGREVSLRAEMTPTLARMVGARAGALPKPIKWYCVPQFFRYERPQRGRGREFIQWNVDVIGSSEPAADAEAIAVAVEGLRRLGLGPDDVVVRLSDRRFLRRMLRSIDVADAVEGEVVTCIDKLERDPAAGKRLEELLGGTRAAQLRAWGESVPLAEADELVPVLEACEDFGLGAWVAADFRIVRGLDYYTGPVWEIFARGRTLRSLAGGGRYDELIAALGGPKLPALGFGMGDMSLAGLLEERGLLPDASARADAFVVPIGEEMQRPARRVLAVLRERGVSADALYAPVRIGKALKAADAAGAQRAILVGPDEWAERAVVVKDLASGQERRVCLDDLE